MSTKEVSCKYNVGVVCVDQTACSVCGWNPAVSALREAKTRAAGLHVDADKIIAAVKRAEIAAEHERAFWVRNNKSSNQMSDWHCSRCNSIQDENHLTKFCPDCGAEMKMGKGGAGNG